MAKDTRRRPGDRHSEGYTAKYHKENYDFLGLRVRKDTGIAEGVRIVAQSKGISPSEYIREAVQNQLAFDGYIPGEVFSAEK